jgi:hypothetical protein
MISTLVRGALGRRGTGYRFPTYPSARETPDFAKLGLPSRELPESFSLREYVVEVLDQGPTNSCVAQAIAQAMRIQRAFRDEPAPLYSPLFFYFNGRARTGDERFDDGTYVASTFDGILDKGMTEEKYWPFNSWKVNRRPSWNAYRMAADSSQIKGWYRVYDDDADALLLAIKSAVHAGRPVVAGWRVNKTFLDDRGPAVVENPSGSMAGGHAMVVTGWDGDNIEVLSSWSSRWRDGGYVLLSPDYAARCTEATVLDLRS